jgi:hypothetical protein
MPERLQSRRLKTEQRESGVSKDKTRFAFLKHILGTYTDTQDSISEQLLFLCTEDGVKRSEQLSKANGSATTTFSTEGD